jgi:hypothetical protein
MLGTCMGEGGNVDVTVYHWTTTEPSIVEDDCEVITVGGGGDWGTGFDTELGGELGGATHGANNVCVGCVTVTGIGTVKGT